jgi:hypothetical protein
MGSKYSQPICRLELTVKPPPSSLITTPTRGASARSAAAITSSCGGTPCAELALVAEPIDTTSLRGRGF